jgi:pimeloyl-ACP methyl ester carboxylesterase
MMANRKNSDLRKRLTLVFSLEAQGVSGFVVVDHSHEIIVLQFGGTNTCPKFDIDVEFGLIDASIIANASCPGCEVHRGFWTAWNNTKNVTLPPVRDAVANYSNYQIVFVGHSLGGALATVGAADFRAQGHNVTLVSRQSPKVAWWALTKVMGNSTAMLLLLWGTMNCLNSSPTKQPAQRIDLHIAPMLFRVSCMTSP